jgi:hypothetical protein
LNSGLCPCYASSPFCIGYFWDRVLLFSLGLVCFVILLFTFPTVAGMTVMYHHAQLFLLRWGSQ